MASPRSSLQSLPAEGSVLRQRTVSFGPALCACVCGPNAPLAHELTVRDLDGVIYVQPGGDAQRPQPGAQANENINREVSAESQRPSVANVKAAEPGKAIEDAAKTGRIVEAWSEMNRLKRGGGDPAAHLSPVVVERIRRIGQRFWDSLAEVMPDQAQDERWKCGISSGGHAFEYCLSNEQFHMVTRTKYEGCSTLHALVGLCEYDLSPAYNSEIRSASCLSDRNSIDSVWRVFKREHPKSVVEDNILQVSAADALKESKFGGLWVSIYTPELQGRAEVAGVRVPQTKPGHARVGFLRNTYRIAPLSPTSDRGFVLTYSLVTRPSPSVCTQLASMPVGELNGMIQAAVDRFPNSFRAHIASETVCLRASAASRDAFYGAVQLRLSGERGLQLPVVSVQLPPGSLRKEGRARVPKMASVEECLDVGAHSADASGTKAAAAEDTDARVSRDPYSGSPERAAPRVPSLEQISHEMPSDWADA